VGCHVKSSVVVLADRWVQWGSGGAARSPGFLAGRRREHERVTGDRVQPICRRVVIRHLRRDLHLYGHGAVVCGLSHWLGQGGVVSRHPGGKALYSWRRAGLDRVVDSAVCRRCVGTLTVKGWELERATFDAARCTELELSQLFGTTPAVHPLPRRPR